MLVLLELTTRDMMEARVSHTHTQACHQGVSCIL